MSDDLRIGLIGCGGLGRAQAKIVAAEPGVELAAVSDVKVQSAQEVAAEHGVPVAVDDHRKLLDLGLDGVLVVTPTFTHKSICLDAARAGVSIFCEKPMATSVADCGEMLQASRASQVQLMIGFVMRFYPAYVAMKRRIDAGDIGDVRLTWAVRMGGRPPVGIGEWRREASKVGGLYSAAIHQMDLLLWMGGPVELVAGRCNWGTFADTDTEDSIIITWRHANGAIGSLHSSQLYPVGGSAYGVGGTKGAFKIEGNTLFFADHEGHSESVEVPVGEAPLALELRHFFDCVRTGEPNRIPGEAGRDAQAVFEAAYMSSERNAPVSLPLG
ncbi:MAG: Gfo/Idh/MocA family oxidoreductase [Armatimonadetes bacterium]|nr:Gfo/Idh/MocA family oxidoreductase [Armatimonadota bacterium]